MDRARRLSGERVLQRFWKFPVHPFPLFSL
jgi:hypothetical protein